MIEKLFGLPVSNILDHFTSPVIILSGDRQIFAINKEAKKLFGLPERSQGLSLQKAKNKNLAKNVSDHLSTVLESKERYMGQVEAGEMVYRGQIVPIFNRGKLSLVTVSLEDWTEVEMARRDLDALLQLLQTFTNNLPLPAMVQTILEQLVFHVDLDEAALIMTLPERPAVEFGTKKKKLTTFHRKVFDEIDRTRQPLAITDTSKPRASGVALEVRENRGRAMLALPLIVRERFMGVLFVTKKEPSYFDYPRFIFFSAVASRLASFIRNEGLIEEIVGKEDQLASVIEYSGEGIAVVDEDGMVTIWNSAMEDLTGVPRAEIVGQTCQVLHDLWGGSPCPLESGLGISDTTFRHRRKGTRQFASVISSEVQVAASQTQRIFLFRDVSKARELEEAQSDFVSLATHQLRTPLTAILGYLSLLSDRTVGRLNDDQQRFVSRISEASHRLSNLVEDLLHVIRLEEDRLAITAHPVDVAKIVEEIMPDFISSAKRNQLVLSMQRGGPLLIQADPKWLKHSVTNLIDNAIKYTPPGGRIIVTWEKGNAEGRPMGIIRVHDTGIGIPKEEQRIIFQKFGRLPGNPMNVSGSGLGLYIAQQLVEKQGGAISVKSTHGKGSTFSLAFPLSRKAATAKVGARGRKRAT